MNRCVSELHGASAFPLKTKTMDDGRVKATCVSVPNGEWFGADEQSAIRHARNDIETRFAKDGLPQTPKWATEFGAKPFEIEGAKK